MKVAITGATGFIGSRLVRWYVERGDTVRALTRRKAAGKMFPGTVAVYPADLASGSGDLRKFASGADVLYHCAGELRDVTRMQATHVDGTRALIAAATGTIGRWVQLSSVGAYGPRYLGVIDETTAERPIGEYETTKARADRLVSEAGECGAFEYSILRPSNVFGVEMSNQSLYQLIRTVDRGLFFFIGSRDAVANYVHVENVCAALSLCASHASAKSRAFIVSDQLPIEQFIGTIARALGRPIPRLRMPAAIVMAAVKTFGRLPGFPLTASRVCALTTRVTYSTDRIVRDLGYRPTVSLESALTELVEAWQRRR